MTRYVLRRLPSAVLVVLAASVVIFSVIRLVPGDPVATLAGPDATPEARDAIRAELGLDEPVVVQYLQWLAAMVRLDPGQSYLVGGDISRLVREGLVNTLVLAGGALLLAVVLTLVAAVGGVLAHRRGVDTLLNGVNTAAVALPTFVTGPLLVLLFAVLLPVLPAGGTPPEGFWARPDISVQFLLMPALCLALPAAAALTRFLSEALRTELEQPYATTARALGVGRRRLVLTQALPNALPAAVTVLGVQVGTLLGGAVLVEAIFAWPGLGMLAEQAISSRDYPLVQTLLLLSVAVFVATQLLTDVVQALLDPRIRLGAS
ncbi:ABC transporter permease [Nocardioides aequoreus]|uniref:ABC transporter permease n=1 Tax=Nocardioides aequoreus TaxID=397278 RepID=UPI0004C38BE2|nr:ABC transporter permease [Nocardioides aequoreus]